MLEKIYSLADFAAVGILLFGGVPAPDILLYACAVVLVLKGLMSFVPMPVYMPSILMCATDIAAAVLIFFSIVATPIKISIIFILLFKALPGLVLSLFGK